VLGADTVPTCSPDLPLGGTRRRSTAATEPAAVFFPACISTMFGPSGAGTGVREAFLALCERAGVAVRVPDRIGSLCCATPWRSKGLADGYAAMGAQVIAILRGATDQGRLPILVDAASCAEGLIRLLDRDLTVVDAVDFVDREVLPLLPEARRLRSVVVHATCSSTQLGLNPAFLRVAAAATEQVIEPDDWRCCAFAGDRGLLRPELTSSATAAEAGALRRQPTASAYRVGEPDLRAGHDTRHRPAVPARARNPRRGHPRAMTP